MITITIDRGHEVLQFKRHEKVWATRPDCLCELGMKWTSGWVEAMDIRRGWYIAIEDRVLSRVVST